LIAFIDYRCLGAVQYLLKNCVTSHALNQLAFDWNRGDRINTVRLLRVLLLVILLLISLNGIAAAVVATYFIYKSCAVSVFSQFAVLAVRVLGGVWVRCKAGLSLATQFEASNQHTAVFDGCEALI